MIRSFASFVVFVAVGGAVGLACSSSTADPGGDFGCCPDVQTGCTLYRYGKKSSADDTCVVGNDGIVPDPSQPGWTRGNDANGCPFWTPPANATRIECGRVPIRDASTDADAAADADASDAPDDASDASGE